MTTQTIETWLTDLGLSQYAGLFEENGIDFDVLGELTADHLKEIGITTLGHRLKLAKAIASLAEGSPQDAPQPSDALASVAQAERRHLTIMFCDLVGSTALSARLDPEDYRDVMTGYQQTVTQVVTGAGGHVAKYLGDGVLIYFGYPIAQEDAAERACRAGLDIIGAVKAMTTVAGETLQVRIGVATGIVVVGDLYGDGVEETSAVSGETPNLAARLQGLANTGQMVIGDKTHALLGEMFVYEQLADVDLKGFEPGQVAWRVLGEAQSTERFTAGTGREKLTPLVGRETERNMAMSVWDKVKTGKGGVFLISGEAGIGKSRLSHEVVNQATADGATLLHYQAAPYYSNTAFYPIRRQIERVMKVQPGDSEEERLTKLENLVQTDGNRMEACALMASLLGLPLDRYPPLNLSPALQKSRMIDMLIEQTRILSRSAPLLVQFEDLHWIDPSSLELLERFIDSVSDRPILLLATSRPEFAPEWTGDHVFSCELNRLEAAELETLLDSLAAGHHLSAEQRSQLLDRSDGVPLFAEELARFLEHSAEQGGELTVPDSLQDSLMARLDKLGNSRELALVGATIGREFDAALLARVANLPREQVADAMQDLVGADLVAPTSDGEAWVFSHALLQEAAYRSMLRAPRQDLHLKIAETLETDFPDRCEKGPEQLATHFTGAAQKGRATPYWLTAGKTAWARASMKEALSHLEAGLDAVGDVTDPTERAKLELQLQSTLGVVHFAATSYASPQAQAAFERARELFADVEDSDLRVAVLYGIGAFQTMRGDVGAGHATFDSLAEEVARSGNDRYEVYSSSTQAWSHFNRGNYTEAVSYGERVLQLYDDGVWDQPGPRLSAADPKVISECFRAAALWSLGFPEQAETVGNAILDYARALPDPYSLVYALANGVIRVHDWNGNWDAVMPLTEECSNIAGEYGYGFLGLWASFWRARAMARNGQLEEAEKMTATAVGACKNAGVHYHGVCFETHHARILLAMDRVEDAANVVSGLQTALVSGGELANAVDLDIVRGEVAAAKGDADAARISFSAALALADTQSALGWQLRAALGLAQQSSDIESRKALLQPILEKFREGQNTYDLKTARGLL